MELQWRARDGRLYNPKDMTTEHICNALAMLKRNGYVSQSTLKFYLTCPPPNGEFAEMAFEREFEELATRPVTPFIDIFEAILKERKYG